MVGGDTNGAPLIPGLACPALRVTKPSPSTPSTVNEAGDPGGSAPSSRRGNPQASTSSPVSSPRGRSLIAQCSGATRLGPCSPGGGSQPTSARSGYGHKPPDRSGRAERAST